MHPVTTCPDSPGRSHPLGGSPAGGESAVAVQADGLCKLVNDRKDEDQGGQAKPGGQSPEETRKGNLDISQYLDSNVAKRLLVAGARQVNVGVGTGNTQKFEREYKQRRIVGKQSITMGSASTLETPPPKRACLGVAMPRERCTYAATSLQPEDAGGHLPFTIA